MEPILNPAQIPEEAKKLLDQNAQYAKILIESYKRKPEEIEALKKTLKVCPTPREVIHQECSVKVWRFTPVRQDLHPVPLFIVPSLILRWYILDLLTGHSLIEHFVKSGIDTYLIDWGVPGDEHGQLTFDYYIDTFLGRAIRKVMRRTGARQIDLMGQCLGGTIAAAYTSLHQDQIRRFIALTTPVDFENAGLLAIWTDKTRFNVDKIVEYYGNTVPADFIHACFQFLDVKATVERYKKLYNNVLDNNFLYYYQALDLWGSDKVPFAAKVFGKFIKGLYQENGLVNKTFGVNGRFVDLKNITCPVLNIAAAFDHVFPERSAKRLGELVSGPVDYHLMQTGHVTLVVLFPERLKTYELMTNFLKK